MESFLTRKSLLRYLVAISLSLLFLHLFGLWLGGNLQKHIPFFDLNYEKNYPAFFSAIYLAFSGYLCRLVACEKQREGEQFCSHWSWLSIIFYFLAFDEFFLIHDRLNQPIRTALNLDGAFYFAWVIPYSLLLVVFALYFYKFVVQGLPVKVRNRFVLSGFLFVLGALGVEMLGAGRAEAFGRSDIWYTILTTIEESLEILGINLFIYFLYCYIEENHPKSRIKRNSVRKFWLISALPLLGITAYNFYRMLR